jgi:hypothetical protein
MASTEAAQSKKPHEVHRAIQKCPEDLRGKLLSMSVSKTRTSTQGWSASSDRPCVDLKKRPEAHRSLPTRPIWSAKERKRKFYADSDRPPPSSKSTSSEPRLKPLKLARIATSPFLKVRTPRGENYGAITMVSATDLSLGCSTPSVYLR